MDQWAPSGQWSLQKSLFIGSTQANHPIYFHSKLCLKYEINEMFVERTYICSYRLIQNRHLPPFLWVNFCMYMRKRNSHSRLVVKLILWNTFTFVLFFLFDMIILSFVILYHKSSLILNLKNGQMESFKLESIENGKELMIKWITSEKRNDKWRLTFLMELI